MKRTSHNWAFYVKDLNDKHILISEKVCKFPSRTKDFKIVGAMFSKNRDKYNGAGAMLAVDFKTNFPENYLL
jgi:hypothetical protein